MVCQLCKQDAPLVKSHIIPRSFYRIVKNRGNNELNILSNIANEHPKKSRIGIYDKIVCESCERLFSPWDDYTQALLLRKISNQIPLIVDNQVLAYRLEGSDYHKLKLFFISLLWRASVSSHKFFSKIQTGRFEPLLNKAIRENDPGNNNFFSVNLAKFNKDLGTAMLDPHPERFEGVNYYRFYLAEYIAHIKVDQRRASPILSDVALSQDKPLIIINRDLHKSAEFRVLQDIIRTIPQTVMPEA